VSPSQTSKGNNANSQRTELLWFGGGGESLFVLTKVKIISASLKAMKEKTVSHR